MKEVFRLKFFKKSIKKNLKLDFLFTVATLNTHGLDLKCPF